MKQMNKNNHFIFRALKTLVIPVAVYLLFTIISGGVFGNANVMITVLKNVCEGAILAWALMIIMITGMLDMSIGAAAILGAIIGGSIAKANGFGMAGWVICIILSCMVISMVTACAVIFTKLPSMVVTLGLVLVYEALTIMVNDSKGISTTYLGLATVPACYIVFLICACIVVFIMHFTKSGNQLRALGSDQANAATMGLNVRKIKFKAFLISGFLVGVASVMMLSYNSKLSSAENMSSVARVFTALMAVVIGQFLSRNCDQILATFIGAFVMKMMASGLLSLGISATWQNVCIGIFLLVFMSISTNQERVNQYFSNRRRARAIMESMENREGGVKV
ncbi:ABC transporter permease [Ruminococcus gauvreauii]|uniref:ABC transporter permease n=1 Tax=Ruminococcus gauvreauii TaxID=438033 RepID=A0ABY5VDD5_9FIRM|nr:ABC transporter permease [Ruminococcus gauvreauii]UWP58302.1 ABC transporter permease [Ruminococcus gauvreauii]